jgi:hypothetical protein
MKINHLLILDRILLHLLQIFLINTSLRKFGMISMAKGLLHLLPLRKNIHRKINAILGESTLLFRKQMGMRIF